MSTAHAAILYVGLNILILVALIVLVIAQRRKHKCALGDGGHQSLKLAIRAHANATETMPIALIGLLALAAIGTSAWVVHAIGIAFTLGRALHAYGMSNAAGPSFGRMAGMILSLTALIVTGFTCVLAAF